METLDLSDPRVMRRLMSDDTDSPPAFITEILASEDSNIELELEPSAAGNEDNEDEEEEEEDRAPAHVGGWRKGVTVQPVSTFTPGSGGLQVQMPEDSTLLDFFQLLVTDEMLETIVSETNRYAANSLRGKQLSPSSRFKKWIAVTVDEIRAFLGIIIAMGLIMIEDLDEYWSTDMIYNLSMFRSVIRRDRFSLIMSFLHLADNENQQPRTHPDYDPLYKIWQFIEPLISNFRSTYIPKERVAIDEAMIAWRGHMSFRCYNPDKPDKFGIKVFELCDCETGYCSYSASAAKKLTHRIFRRELAKQLISFVPLIVDIPRGIDLGDNCLLRLTARHFPTLIQPKPGAETKNPQCDCIVCSEPDRRMQIRECWL